MQGVGVHLLCSLPEIREIFRHGNVAASMFKQKLATIYSCRIFLLCKWHLITLYGFRSSTLVTRPMLQQRSHAKHSKIFVCGQYILQLNDWSWKISRRCFRAFLFVASNAARIILGPEAVLDWVWRRLAYTFAQPAFFLRAIYILLLHWKSLEGLSGPRQTRTKLV